MNPKFSNRHNYPADTQCWNNVESTLIQRQERLINVETPLFQRCVPAG